MESSETESLVLCSFLKSKISPLPNGPTAGILGPDLVFWNWNWNLIKFEPIFIVVPELEPTGIDSITTTVAGTGTGTGTVS